MPTLGAPLDFSQLEARQIRIHVLASAPSSPVGGQMYYNSVNNTLFWYDSNLAAFVSARGGGAPAAHATTHQPGGSDPMAVDQAAATASLRTLGTGVGSAAAGQHKTQHEPGGADAMTIDSASVGSLRTLAYSGNAAMPGVAKLNDIATNNGASAAISANGQRITLLGTPSSATDAAPKGYVDSAIQGLDVKASCRLGSTTNTTIATPGSTFDGVTAVVGDRILLVGQTTQTANGIYVFNGGASAMTRATDADSSGAGFDVNSGMYTFIEEGNTLADSGWILTTNDPINLGSTNLVFTQFSGAGQIVDGAGLLKTGNTLDVKITAGRTIITADAVDIDPAWVGQATITTLGTIGTGSWNATTIPVAKGGTGQTTQQTARETGLGAAGYYSGLWPSSTTNTWAIPPGTHGLRGATGLLVQCQIDSTGVVVLPDVSVSNIGGVTITFGANQTSNTIRVTIIG